jgi:hypothetical protein
VSDVRQVGSAYAVIGLTLAIASSVGAIGLRLVDPVPMVENTFGFSDAALLGFECFGVTFAAVGGLLVVRRRGNAVGWLMVFGGVAHAGGGLGAVITSAALADGPTGAATAAVAAWATLACVTVGASVFLLAIIFPTGRGHTPRWHRFAWLSLLIFAVVAAVVLTQPGPLNTFPAIENPFPIGPRRTIAGLPLSQALTSVSVAFGPILAWAIASRYRASDMVGRRQLKWFILAMLVTIGALAIAMLAPLATDDPPELALALFGFGGALVAIAIGIAILRHGLYDIDRLLSRTISYGIVTGVLVATFTISVVGLSAVMGSAAAGNSLAVALATLLVAALVGPLRRRAQATIDRRFDRAHYDATITIETLTSRLRHDVAIEHVETDVVGVVDRTFHPVAAGLWLRPRQRYGADLVTFPGRGPTTVGPK